MPDIVLPSEIDLSPFGPGDTVISQAMAGTGTQIEWGRVSRPDLGAIVEIAKRISIGLARIADARPDLGVIAPSWVAIGADLGMVHLLHGLRLDDMTRASNGELLIEYATIAKFIDRPGGTFPNSFMLRFAQHRA